MATTETARRTPIRKHDIVQVIAGREAQANKRGRVLEVLIERNRVLVEKVNMVKRHQKPNQKNRQGGIIEKEASLHISNVMLVCEKCNRPVRVGIKRAKGKDAERICRKCGEIIPKRKG